MNYINAKKYIIEWMCEKRHFTMLELRDMLNHNFEGDRKTMAYRIVHEIDKNRLFAQHKDGFLSLCIKEKD